MANLRILLLFVVITGFALSFNACTKHKKRDYIELDSDSAVITHFNFKVGSYWIYVDAKSGRTDSFYVRSNVHAPQTEAYNIYDYHFITIAQVNIDNTNPGDSANWVLNYQDQQIMLDYNYSTFTWGWRYDIQYQPLFRYPFPMGDQAGRYDTAAITQVDSALIINGTPYYNVAHVIHISNADSTMGTYITKLHDLFYVNDSVGLVEMTISHPYHGIDRDWRLLRCNIVK